jgi:hypothetical protein
VKGNLHWLARVAGEATRPALPYLLPRELVRFREMRQAGQITMFHVAKCETCEREIPRVDPTPVIGELVPLTLKWCSKQCFDQRPK